MPKILIVEDDPLVRDITGELLITLGHEVLVAENGKQAQDIVEKNADSIDLILLDLSLPDIDGVDLFPRLLAIRPELKIIISSGSMMGFNDDDLFQQGIRGVLPKPFGIDALQQKIDQVLGSV